MTQPNTDPKGRVKEAKDFLKITKENRRKYRESKPYEKFESKTKDGKPKYYKEGNEWIQSGQYENRSEFESSMAEENSGVDDARQDLKKARKQALFDEHVSDSPFYKTGVSKSPLHMNPDPPIELTSNSSKNNKVSFPKGNYKTGTTDFPNVKSRKSKGVKTSDLIDLASYAIPVPVFKAAKLLKGAFNIKKLAGFANANKSIISTRKGKGVIENWKTTKGNAKKQLDEQLKKMKK